MGEQSIHHRPDAGVAVPVEAEHDWRQREERERQYDAHDDERLACVAALVSHVVHDARVGNQGHVPFNDETFATLK